MQGYCALIIPSPLGSLLAIADDNAVCVVQIISDDLIDTKVNDYQKLWNAVVTFKANKVLELLRHELKMYFTGKLHHFTVPIAFMGTAFQQKTWNSLCKIPYAQTVSYAQVAASIGNPKAVRAVGGANRANPVMIIVPCHRVIQANGKLGGYASGVDHKLWLLRHENIYAQLR